MMEPALQLALHGTAYRTGAVTSARRVLMNYELGRCAGDWQGPQLAVKGRHTGLFRPNSALGDSKHSLQCLGVLSVVYERTHRNVITWVRSDARALIHKGTSAKRKDGF